MTTLVWPRTKTHKLRTKHASQFMADVDRVWLSVDAPDEGAPLLALARTLPANEGAELLLEQIRDHTRGDDLAHRLALIGIAVGTLSPNRGVPKGVRGIWRSTLPVVLVTRNVPRGTSRAREIAEEVGHLIYGDSRDGSARLLASTFAVHFKTGIEDL